MNTELYNKLLKQYQDSVSYTHYNSNITWVKKHLERLCTEFAFLGIGKPIKCTIDGTTRVCSVDEFIIETRSLSPWIGVETGFGGIWYYETIEPTKEELNEFDGHCLVIED
jgi:hypothetical protein